MVLTSMGVSKWRMLRRALTKPQFCYSDVRNQSIQDRENFDWLVKNGFIAAIGGDRYQLTEKGTQSAELGLYEA